MKNELSGLNLTCNLFVMFSPTKIFWLILILTLFGFYLGYREVKRKSSDDLIKKNENTIEPINVEFVINIMIKIKNTNVMFKI